LMALSPPGPREELELDAKQFPAKADWGPRGGVRNLEKNEKPFCGRPRDLQLPRRRDRAGTKVAGRGAYRELPGAGCSAAGRWDFDDLIMVHGQPLPGTYHWEEVAGKEYRSIYLFYYHIKLFVVL